MGLPTAAGPGLRGRGRAPHAATSQTAETEVKKGGWAEAVGLTLGSRLRPTAEFHAWHRVLLRRSFAASPREADGGVQQGGLRPSSPPAARSTSQFSRLNRTDLRFASRGRCNWNSKKVSEDRLKRLPPRESKQAGEESRSGRRGGFRSSRHGCGSGMARS